MYLVDTSIVSFSFRTDPLLQLYEDELNSGAPLLASAQTVTEIFVGMLSKGWGTKQRTRMDQTLARFAILAMDQETARICAEVIIGAQAAGRPLELGDAWILATARRYSLIVVTHDRDMTVGELLGIKVVCRA